jgi:hypothetical protein
MRGAGKTGAHQKSTGSLSISRGRDDDARRVFVRLLEIRNDVGLPSEEYDPATRRLLGNFPQAFTHVGPGEHGPQPIPARGPAEHRQGN